MKTGKNRKHWRIIALVMIIGLSLFACDNGLNGGNGGGDPTDLDTFFAAIGDNEGNFSVNATITLVYGWRDIEIKVAGKNSYFYSDEFNDSGAFVEWWEGYLKTNYPVDGIEWYRWGITEEDKKTGDFSESTEEHFYINKFLINYEWMIYELAYFADEGAFTKNGNEYTMSDDNYDIVLYKITISPESVSIYMEDYWTIYTFNFTNFNSTSVVLPD